MIVQTNPPRAFGYRRYFPLEIQQPELRLEAQAQQIRDYYEKQLKPNGYAWGGDFVDDTDAARTTPFIKRAAGKALDNTAAKGDVIVIPRIGTAFRSIMEFADVLADWHGRGIGVAIIAEDIETWIPEHAEHHDLFCAALVSYRESESARISEDTREAMQERKRRGFFVGGCFPPPGKRRFGKRLIDDPKDRATCRLVVELREKCWSVYQIFAYLRREGIRRTDGRAWTRDMIGRAFWIETQRQYLEQKAEPGPG